ILEIIQRVVVLRPTALEVRADEQAAELVALVEIGNRRSAGGTEESTTAILLIKAVLFVVSIVAAQRKGPVADGVVDIEPGTLPLESVQELNRAALIEGVPAGVVGGVARPASKVNVLLPKRLGLRELLNCVVVVSGPELVLEHVPQR